MLTDEEQAEYLDNPIFCPYCGSRAVEAKTLENHGTSTVIGTTLCHACDTPWEDVYVLAAIKEIV